MRGKLLLDYLMDNDVELAIVALIFIPTSSLIAVILGDVVHPMSPSWAQATYFLVSWLFFQGLYWGIKGKWDSSRGILPAVVATASLLSGALLYIGASSQA